MDPVAFVENIMLFSSLMFFWRLIVFFSSMGQPEDAKDTNRFASGLEFDVIFIACLLLKMDVTGFQQQRTLKQFVLHGDLSGNNEYQKEKLVS